MKKMYEKPSVDVIAMETEQSMATLSSYNTTAQFENLGELVKNTIFVA